LLKWHEIVQTWHNLNTHWISLFVEWELSLFHSIILLAWFWEVSRDTNHLSFSAVGSNFYRGFGFFHVRKLSKLAYWTSMVILHKWAPEVFPTGLTKKNRHIIQNYKNQWTTWTKQVLNPCNYKGEAKHAQLTFTAFVTQKEHGDYM
jgi:hypothetical protein